MAEKISLDRSNLKWLPSFLNGLVVVIIASVILWINRPKTELSLYDMGAKGIGISTESYKRAMDRLGKAEKQKQLSDADWFSLKEDFKNPKIQPICVSTIAFLNASFKHREEAIQMVLEYTRTIPIYEGIPAGAALRKLEYPGWKDYARKIMNCDNPEIRYFANRQFGKHL